MQRIRDWWCQWHRAAVGPSRRPHRATLEKRISGKNDKAKSLANALCDDLLAVRSIDSGPILDVE